MTRYAARFACLRNRSFLYVRGIESVNKQSAQTVVVGVITVKHVFYNDHSAPAYVVRGDLDAVYKRADVGRIDVPDNISRLRLRYPAKQQCRHQCDKASLQTFMLFH